MGQWPDVLRVSLLPMKRRQDAQLQLALLLLRHSRLSWRGSSTSIAPRKTPGTPSSPATRSTWPVRTMRGPPNSPHTIEGSTVAPTRSTIGQRGLRSRLSSRTTTATTSPTTPSLRP
eukprot:2407218-Heterocapsa_arctica.AAC.1